MTAEIKWTPARVAGSEIAAGSTYVGARMGRPVASSEDLAILAPKDPEGTWSALWNFFGPIGEKGEAPFITGSGMIDTRFLAQARQTFFETLIELGTDRDPVADAKLTMLVDRRRKYVFAEGFRPMLFDLDTDPKELRDPGDDPAQSDTLARMQGLFFD
ncbi:hypothetical protein N9W17_04255 [Jannaschia sp.]|nr:hypothetical protein [Jannaschia sp.]